MCVEPCGLGHRLMVMVVERILTGAAVMVALVLSFPTSAAAGGAHWRFDRDAYHVGEVATGVTAIAWEHNPALGTPADGPYFGYLLPVGQLGDTAVWPSISEGALKVGQVEINDGPVEEAPGFWVGPHHARLEFTVPALPAGSYAVLHCNDPCTTPLADIIGGSIVIGSAGGDLAGAPTSQPTRSTSRAGVVQLSTTGASGSAVGRWLPYAGVAVGAIALLAVLRFYQQRTVD